MITGAEDLILLLIGSDDPRTLEDMLGILDVLVMGNVGTEQIPV